MDGIRIGILIVLGIDTYMYLTRNTYLRCGPTYVYAMGNTS